jgi:hypothetical protein
MTSYDVVATPCTDIEDPLAGLLASRLKSGDSASFAVAMLVVIVN